MSKKIFVEALFNMWKIKKITGRDSGIDQFIKFAVTGALGTVTNLLIFFLCADIFHLPEIPVSIFCFLIAASQNYYVNHRWSFRQNTGTEALSIKKWLEFTGASLLGLAVNIIVMKAVLLNFSPAFKVIAQACGIASGMVINFILSKMFVFRKKPFKGR
jgi:putative flippase GtrA